MRLVIDMQGAQGVSHLRGIGRYSRELALAMARAPRGHEVIIALSSALPETAEALSTAFASILPRQQIRIMHLPTDTAVFRNSSLQTLAEGLRGQFLASLQPDLVHVCSLFEGLGDDIVSLPPRRLQRLPVVATCYDLIPLIRHKQYFGESGVLSSGTNWYYRCAHEMSLCDGLLAISESSRSEAIRHLSFPSDRVFNVQAGVSTEFRPVTLSNDARAALLALYGVRDGFVLFLGAGDVRKNEAGLIAAYARLPSSLQDRHQLVIVGHTEEEALRRTTAGLGISPRNFTIVPFVAEADLNGLYSACAVFVFPSLHEGFGLPVAEAMACGAPTIASNTSSLPEVIGRADATFDPTDPADIARCLRKVLENPGFRADLAAYGPVQAGRFTWQSSAARSWDALEQIYAVRQQHDCPTLSGVLLPRPRLAFISPMPPQASGIADYSRDLLPSLGRYYDITVISEADNSDIGLHAIFPRLDPAEFLAQAGNFDRVLYQVGNSSFHRFQIQDLLPNCPGVVVLHDAFLSDYMNWLAHDAGRPDDFRAVLLESHGYEALRYEACHGRSAAMAEYPCSLPVLKASVGVIQHSRHGVEVLDQHFGAAAASRVAIVPLLKAARALPARNQARASLGLGQNDFVVCSFGSVAAVKCPGLLADAWRRTGLAGHLVFVGNVQPELRSVVTDAPAGISHTGRLSLEQYDAWLAAADVAVQWRKGSRGESSAAVADAMMAAVPLIINRHGSASELPEEVALALPDQADSALLADAIISLHADPERRRALSTAARSYVLHELAPEIIARQYRDAIETAYATPQPATMARHLAPEIQIASSRPDGLLAASRGIGNSFSQPWRTGGHPRLLIDMSGLARRDDGSDIQRVVREIARRMLETPPAGRRGGAVRATEGRVRHTHAAPLHLLGHPPLSLPETPLDAADGDVLVCADVNTELTLAEFTELRRLRLAGLRIVVVVHDLLPMRHPELFPQTTGPLFAHWYSRMLGIADVAACVSQTVAQDLAAWLHENRHVRTAPLPIGAFHLGADSMLQAGENPITSNIAGPLAAARRRPTIVMTGTVEPGKAYPQVLAAFEQLWRDGVDIGLTIIGTQGWRMESFAEHLHSRPQIGERLHWLSSCTDPELALLYSAGAGLLMASNHEGSALPIIEAAQAGLPIMARDTPLFREVAGEHAGYFSGDRPDDLALALQAWQAAGFTPSPTGMARLSWDESCRELHAIIFEDHRHLTWHP